MGNFTSTYCQMSKSTLEELTEILAMACISEKGLRHINAVDTRPRRPRPPRRLASFTHSFVHSTLEIAVVVSSR